MGLTKAQKDRINNPNIINVGGVIATKQSDGTFKDAKGNIYNAKGKKIN